MKLNCEYYLRKGLFRVEGKGGNILNIIIKDQWKCVVRANYWYKQMNNNKTVKQNVREKMEKKRLVSRIKMFTSLVSKF